jgi:hypothetical protein
VASLQRSVGRIIDGPRCPVVDYNEEYDPWYILRFDLCPKTGLVMDRISRTISRCRKQLVETDTAMNQ